jgi:hypothetical protein
MFIWNILRPFGTFYGHFVMHWYCGIFAPVFGILCQEKSGNPAFVPKQDTRKVGYKTMLF